MKLKRILLVVLATTMMSSCSALVSYASEALKEMQDTNRYEEIRDSVSVLCETKNYGMFVDRFGKETVDKWMTETCSPVTRTTEDPVL